LQSCLPLVNQRCLSLFFILGLWFSFFAAAQSAQQDKPDALANYRLGRELEARGRADEASSYYAIAARICSDEIQAGAANMDTYTVFTWTLQRQRKYSEVVRWGQQALRIRDDYRIIETMGEAYFYLEDYDASLRNMQRYAQALPQGDKASVAFFFIGEIFRVKRKFMHADIAYTTAVHLERGMALWWYRLGLAREAARESVYAAQAFEQALKINPQYQEASDALKRVRPGAASSPA
jgi:tetratricopeptide (TPR) repeat protein